MLSVCQGKDRFCTRGCHYFRLRLRTVCRWIWRSEKNQLPWDRRISCFNRSGTRGRIYFWLYAGCAGGIDERKSTLLWRLCHVRCRAANPIDENVRSKDFIFNKCSRRTWGWFCGRRHYDDYRSAYNVCGFSADRRKCRRIRSPFPGYVWDLW